MAKKTRARLYSGRYDFDDFSLMCKCGHSLGVHAAGDGGKRPCYNNDAGDGKYCDCETFRKKTTKK